MLLRWRKRFPLVECLKQESELPISMCQVCRSGIPNSRQAFITEKLRGGKLLARPFPNERYLCSLGFLSKLCMVWEQNQEPNELGSQPLHLRRRIGKLFTELFVEILIRPFYRIAQEL